MDFSGRKYQYLVRLVRASFLVSLAPFILLSVYTIYGKLSLLDALYGALASFIVAVLSVRPYVSDISALTYYVDELSQDRRPKAPSLGFLSNIGPLSASVRRLNRSWEKKALELEAMLVEGKILFDILPDMLWMIDAEMHIIRANSKAHTVFSKFMKNCELKEVIDDEALISAVSDVITTREGKTLEFFLPEPIGQYYLVIIEPFPVFSPGGITAIISMHNITTSKNTEQLLADFVANASHEIRTPLTSLIGFVETLQTVAKDDEKARDYFLSIMATQAERMSRLVNDLLSLSKIEMNISTMPTNKVHLAAVVESVVKQMEWSAKEKEMPLLFTKTDKEETRIIGDHNELMQLATNLISNAIKYGYRGGSIKVSIWICPAEDYPDHIFHVQSKARALVLSVQDQGEGIPKEHLPRLTERFYRVDSARTQSKIEGTGLGLSIVHNIIKRHRGDLVIASRVGIGSTFSVYFPIADE